jgi:hypothetical protein
MLGRQSQPGIVMGIVAYGVSIPCVQFAGSGGIPQG